MCQKRSGLGVVRGRYVNTLRTKGCCVNNATLHFIAPKRAKGDKSQGRQYLKVSATIESALFIFVFRKRNYEGCDVFDRSGLLGGRAGWGVLLSKMAVLSFLLILSTLLGRNLWSRSLLKPLSRLLLGLDSLEFMTMVMCTMEGRGGIPS
jgi:hypothetical protein